MRQIIFFSAEIPLISHIVFQWGSLHHSAPLSASSKISTKCLRRKVCYSAMCHTREIRLSAFRWSLSNFRNTECALFGTCSPIYHPQWSDLFCHVIVYVDDLVVSPESLCSNNSEKLDRVHLIETVDLVPTSSRVFTYFSVRWLSQVVFGFRLLNLPSLALSFANFRLVFIARNFRESDVYLTISPIELCQESNRVAQICICQSILWL